jgi:transcriptional regulator with XRE-family HTH domain
MESDDIMRVSEADREILERVLNVRRILDLKDVMQLLRSEIKRAGSQRAFARKAGVNVSVVSKTLRGQVLPSEKILRALNLSVVYLSK